MCFSAGTLFSLPIYGKSLLTGVEDEFLISFSKKNSRASTVCFTRRLLNMKVMYGMDLLLVIAQKLNKSIHRNSFQKDGYNSDI